MKIKQFSFPSFEEWFNSDKKYIEMIGIYTCEISIFGFGTTSNTVECAISKDPIPANIYSDKLYTSSLDYKILTESDTVLKDWYKKVVIEANKVFADHIKNEYIEDNNS